MTRKADTLRPFLRCAVVVLCSLALPLAVFALWDRALLAAPHIRTDGERFSAAGRANATAWPVVSSTATSSLRFSSRASSVAIEELKTICACGRKAICNGRKVNGEFVFEGAQVAIDTVDNVEYQSLCPQCWYREYRAFLARHPHK